MANFAIKRKKGKLFGKPKGQVVKRPGALTAKAKAAGESTGQYAQEHKHAAGRTGKQARLAILFRRWAARRKGK
jgi:hypothetical protein